MAGEGHQNTRVSLTNSGQVHGIVCRTREVMHVEDRSSGRWQLFSLSLCYFHTNVCTKPPKNQWPFNTRHICGFPEVEIIQARFDSSLWLSFRYVPCVSHFSGTSGISNHVSLHGKKQEYKSPGLVVQTILSLLESCPVTSQWQ